MRTIILTLAALAVAGPAAAQTRIFSETFDTVNPGNYGDGNNIGSFSVDASDVDIVGDQKGSFFNCPNGAGNNCVDLSGNSPGTISALVNLVAGNTYHVSFDIAGNGPRSTDYDMVAGFSNSPWFEFKAAPLSSFRNVGFDYVAKTTGVEQLIFQSLSLDSPRYWGMIVDNVAIDNLSAPGAVPEPAAWAMMILGMGAIGFSLRRSRRGAAALSVA